MEETKVEELTRLLQEKEKELQKERGPRLCCRSGWPWPRGSGRPRHRAQAGEAQAGGAPRGRRAAAGLPPRTPPLRRGLRSRSPALPTTTSSSSGGRVPNSCEPHCLHAAAAAGGNLARWGPPPGLLPARPQGRRLMASGVWASSPPYRTVLCRRVLLPLQTIPVHSILYTQGPPWHGPPPG